MPFILVHVVYMAQMRFSPTPPHVIWQNHLFGGTVIEGGHTRWPMHVTSSLAPQKATPECKQQNKVISYLTPISSSLNKQTQWTLVTALETACIGFTKR